MTPNKSRIQQSSILLSGIIFALGIIVLIGWFAHIVTLETVIPGFITMKANTAICFLCCALALWALLGLFPRRLQTPVVVVCVAVMVVLAGGSGLEYISGRQFGMDELFFRDYVQYQFPGRMAPVTALNFVLIAFGLAGMGISGRYVRQFQAAAIFVGFSALFAISGYIFGVPVLYGSIRYTAMALHTGLGFLLISWAMLCAKPRDGLMRVIFSAGPGGVLARMYMPVAILVPTLIGRVFLSPVLNFGDLRLGMAMLVLTCNILFVAITWAVASSIEKSQLALNESEAQFRELANAIPQLCWMANADGWIFWYNQRWFEYTGTAPEQMEGWGWQSVHDPEALPTVMARWQGSIATGEPFDMVFPLRGADGVFRPFLTRVMPVKDADGKAVRWFGTNTDISEQKRAEIELRKRKERLDLAVEVAGLGEWELNLTDGTASNSPRHQQIFGYSSPLPDWNYAKFLEHVLPELRDSFDRQINSGNSWSVETKIRRADGEVRWIWVRGRRRVNDAGQVVRMFGVVTDITERKQAEEERARLAAIVESSGDAIISKDLNGIVWSWNQSAERLFGYSAQEMIGQPITLIIPHERLGEETEFLERLSRGECIEHYETVRFDKQGRSIDVSVTLSPVYDSTGAVAGVSKSVRDITEWKQAQEALRSSEAKLHGVVGSAMDAIISVDDAQRIVVFNQAAENIFQCAASEAVGSTLDRFIPQPLREVHREHIRRFGSQGATNRSMTSPGMLIGVRSNGEEFPIEATISQVWAAGQTLYTVILRDITARKQAEDALLRQAEMLRLSFDAIIVWRLGGSIESWNRGAQQLYGYSESEALGRVTHELLGTIHSVPWPEIEAALQRFGHWEGELRHITKDGREVTVVSRHQLIVGTDGVERILETNRDITERKQAEEALQASEQRYRTLFETMDEGFCIVEVLFDAEERPVDYRFLQVNPAFEKQTGMHGAEGKRMREIAPAHEAHWFEIYGRIALTGESAHFMNEARALNRWFDVHAYRVGAPELRRVAIVFNDISDYKRAEQALLASEHRWATTLRSIGDAVISTDSDGNIDFMNEVAQNLTGWALEEAKGKDLTVVFDIVQEVTRIRPESPVAKVIRLGQIVGLANHTVLIHRDGNEIPIEDSAAPIRDSQGQMEGVVLVFHDCLEQRKVEAALRSSERLATTGRLAATIAHEIHNPLDAVGNLLFLIRRGSQGGEHAGVRFHGQQRTGARDPDDAADARLPARGGQADAGEDWRDSGQRGGTV